MGYGRKAGTFERSKTHNLYFSTSPVVNYYLKIIPHELNHIKKLTNSLRRVFDPIVSAPIPVK